MPVVFFSIKESEKVCSALIQNYGFSDPDTIKMVNRIIDCVNKQKYGKDKRSKKTNMEKLKPIETPE